MAKKLKKSNEYAPFLESIFIALLVALILSFLEFNRFMFSLVSEAAALLSNAMILLSFAIFSGLVYAYVKQIKIPKEIVKILVIGAVVMLFLPFLIMMVLSY